MNDSEAPRVDLHRLIPDRVDFVRIEQVGAFSRPFLDGASHFDRARFCHVPHGRRFGAGLSASISLDVSALDESLRRLAKHRRL